MNDVNRRFEGEHHHHDGQRPEDEVHFPAGKLEDRLGQIDSPDRQSEHRQRQLPVVNPVVQQSQTDHERHEKELRVLFRAPDPVQLGDDDGTSREERLIAPQAAIPQFTIDVGNGARAVLEPFVGKEHDQSGQLAVGRKRQSFQAFPRLVGRHAGLRHDDLQPLRRHAAANPRQPRNSPADCLDQLVVGEFAFDADQDRFFDPEVAFELLVLRAYGRLARQPGLDVVVTRNRLSFVQQVGKAERNRPENHTAESLIES